MKLRFKRILPLLLALLLLAGCGGGELELYTDPAAAQPAETLRLITDLPAAAEPAPDAGPDEAIPGPDWMASDEPDTGSETYQSPAPSKEAAASASPDSGSDAELLSPDGPDETVPPLAEDGEYTAPQDVADYLHAYGHLPDNFITKREAQDLGWPGGNLWKYAPGKSIGGDRFGNYEGLLPKGRYRECDVNYSGGRRGAERIIYGEDGSIWYTADHYESFTQLY